LLTVSRKQTKNVSLEEWLNIDRLQLNVSKIKVMLVRGIRKKVSESNIKVKLDNTILEVVSEIKYLGDR